MVAGVIDNGGGATADLFRHFELVDLLNTTSLLGRPQVRSNFDGRSEGSPLVHEVVGMMSFHG